MLIWTTRIDVGNSRNMVEHGGTPNQRDMEQVIIMILAYSWNEFNGISVFEQQG